MSDKTNEQIVAAAMTRFVRPEDEAMYAQSVVAALRTRGRLVGEPTGDQVSVYRSTLTYAALALEESHDDGDQYCASQIRAALTSAGVNVGWDEAAEQGVAPQAPSRERGDLWASLDWTLWGVGMGDTFREPLADKMIAALSDEEFAQAEAMIRAGDERRGGPFERNLFVELKDERDEARAALAAPPVYDEAKLAEVIRKVDLAYGENTSPADYRLAAARAVIAHLTEGKSNDD